MATDRHRWDNIRFAEVDGIVAIPQDRVDELLKNVEKQLDFETACYCAGIPWSHMTWVARQAAAHPGGEAEDLMIAIVRAKAEGKATLVTKLYDSDSERWTAWLLEKVYPEQYGRKIEVSASREDNMRALSKRLAQAEPEALLEAAFKERRPGPDIDPPELEPGDFDA